VCLRVFLPPFLELLLPLTADLALTLIIGFLKSILGIDIPLNGVALCFIVNENPEGFIVFADVDVLLRLLIII
jgi:hypothetical protein